MKKKYRFSKIALIIILSFLKNNIWSFNAIAQKVSINYQGQINIASNFSNSLFLNLGGPSIVFVFKKINVGLGMLPSLRYFENKPSISITPVLGVGPFFAFGKNKKINLGLPVYYYSNFNKWAPAFSIGYNFNQKLK